MITYEHSKMGVRYINLAGDCQEGRNRREQQDTNGVETNRAHDSGARCAALKVQQQTSVLLSVLDLYSRLSN